MSHGQAIQLKMCDNKRRFSNERGAQVQVAILKTSDRPRQPNRLSAYRCAYCDQWHVGHARYGKQVYK